MYAVTLPRSLMAAVLVSALSFAVECRADRLGPLPQNDPTNAEALPTQLEGADIQPNLGAQLPVDTQLIDQDGRAVRLSDYLSDGKPTLLVFAYYSCPMLCTLVLNGLTQGLKALPWTAGRDFRVLTVSIDPRDTPQVAHDKRLNYLRTYGREVEERGWEFLTGTPEQVSRLASTAGFHYRWDESQQQYAHAAGVFFLTPEGKLSRVLYGVSFDPQDIRLALSDASGGKVSTLTERILLFCFHYEPSVGKYVLAAKKTMRIAGIGSTLILGLFVGALFRRERRRAATERVVSQGASGAA